MKLDDKGYLLITKFEGFSAKPYLCSAAVPTIGYGSTFYEDGSKVTITDKPITKERAIDLFKVVADKFAKEVTKLVVSNINQNQFNALVSFAYNVGSDIDTDTIAEGLGDSTLLKKVNKNPNDLTIRYEFLKWNKAGGKIVTGLTRRRNEEASIYFS
jgi:lysozyme